MNGETRCGESCSYEIMVNGRYIKLDCIVSSMVPSFGVLLTMYATGQLGGTYIEHQSIFGGMSMAAAVCEETQAGNKDNGQMHGGRADASNLAVGMRLEAKRITVITWTLDFNCLVFSASATQNSSTESSGAWSPGRTWIWLNFETLEDVLTHACAAPSGHCSAASARPSSRSPACPNFQWSSLAVIRTIDRRSPRTTCLTYSTLSSVLLVESLPLLESFSTSLRSSLNLNRHSRHAIATSSHLCTLATAFRVLLLENSPAGPKTSGWFIALCS